MRKGRASEMSYLKQARKLSGGKKSYTATRSADEASEEIVTWKPSKSLAFADA